MFQTPLLWWAAEPLKLSAPPEAADAIVVFAGGVGESGQAGGGYQERVKQAIDLYKAGYARSMVLSSGYVYSFREAEVMRALAVDNGVPASAIVLELRATSTYQNVVFVDDILRDHHWQKILLVSSPYHMRRATMVWRKLAPRVTVIPSPPPQSQFYDHPRAGATLDADSRHPPGVRRDPRLLAPQVAVNAGGWRKLLFLTVPAAAVMAIVMAAAVEVWVRATWEPRKGRPGFFLTDAVRGQRLAAGYDGWFAGVPVHINRLELRDRREYELAKRPNTFRILVLGDSVTFGHGSVAEHTYPFLLEQRLKAWRSDVDWQVWNAAVPGYNTSQELAHLLEAGPRMQPDLVVVGFFENDLIDNRDVGSPGLPAKASAATLSFLRRHVYSLELYKRVYLQLAWMLSRSDDYHRRVEHLGTEESLLAGVEDASALKQQTITPFERFTDEQVRDITCVYGMKPNAALDPGHRARERVSGLGRSGPGISAPERRQAPIGCCSFSTTCRPSVLTATCSTTAVHARSTPSICA